MILLLSLQEMLAEELPVQESSSKNTITTIFHKI
jgi:hypothetical protein